MKVHLFGAASGIGKWLVSHLLLPKSAPESAVTPWQSVVLWDTEHRSEWDDKKRLKKLKEQKKHPYLKLLQVPNEDQALERSVFSQGDLLLLAVPQRALPGLAVQLSTVIQPDTTVFNLTSVQEKPLAILRSALPEAVIAGLHLLFGPSTHTLRNKNIVLVDYPRPIYSEAVEELVNFLKKREAKLSSVSAKEHDLTMVYVQTATHFTLRVFAELLKAAEDDGIDLHRMSTPPFKKLNKLADRMFRQTPETLKSIQAMPAHKECRAKFLKIAQRLHEQMNSIDSNDDADHASPI